jgi:hypothetical protein
MLRLSYRRSRVRWAARAGRIEISACLLALLAVAPSFVGAQRPPTVTSVRHSKPFKEVLSLDWVGLYDQLEPYARWWKETASCAGIPLQVARVDSVQFYYVNAVDFLPAPTDKPNRMVGAVTYAATEQIYVSILHLRDEIVVKHEMIHQILYWWGEPTWDNDARMEFERCGLQAVL